MRTVNALAAGLALLSLLATIVCVPYAALVLLVSVVLFVVTERRLGLDVRERNINDER